MPQRRRLAICMSDKKFEKLNFKEMSSVFTREGFEIFKLDLNQSLEAQEPFSVLLHKLTDTIVAANEGDIKNSKYLRNIKKYLQEHPDLIVIDPLPNIKKLLNRYVTYSIISETNLHTFGVFIPNFCELSSPDINDIESRLKNKNITYPFLCKSIPGHGSSESHKMSIIFNKQGLIDCKIPSVAQSFVQHNAVLYKIFTVGEKFVIQTRPSLKNYIACDRNTIFFDSSTVSKATSQSELTILDPEDEIEECEPDNDLLKLISTTLCSTFGMDLIGIDVVIENKTGKYAVIDVNAYPGYDNFPNFYENLLECVKKKF